MPDCKAMIERLNNLKGIPAVIIGRIESGYPLYMITHGEGDIRVALSAGIHGDEPAGVEALLRFLEGTHICIDEGIKKWDKVFKFTVFPCTNPTGFEKGTRENINGIDLNRKFNSTNPPEEVMILQDALKGGQFDLYMDFHEDTDGEGFYLYEVMRKGVNHLSEEIIKNISRNYPVDRRECIDGFPNCGGVICPQKDRKRFHIRKKDLPLPLYLYLRSVKHCLTIESPTRFPMEERVGMHLMALDIVLNLIKSVQPKL